MPMSDSDYFNEYLEKDWQTLDKELSSDRWFRSNEQELLPIPNPAEETIETEEQIIFDDVQNTNSPTEVRDTYNRRRQRETKQERIERIKSEYSQRPSIFVSADIQRRREKRMELIKKMQEEADKNKPVFDSKYPQNTQQDPAMEGTQSLGAGFTQLVGSKIRSFCRKA